MEKVIIIRYAEIYLKGKNRGFFEKKLRNNIKDALKEVTATLVVSQNRFVIKDYKVEEEPLILEKLKKVFGIYF